MKNMCTVSNGKNMFVRQFQTPQSSRTSLTIRKLLQYKQHSSILDSWIYLLSFGAVKTYFDSDIDLNFFSYRYKFHQESDMF